MMFWNPQILRRCSNKKRCSIMAPGRTVTTEVDELGFGLGNELSWMNTFLSVGILVGGLFANLIITVVRPSYWLPRCMAGWSLLVLGMYRCDAASQIHVL